MAIGGVVNAIMPSAAMMVKYFSIFKDLLRYEDGTVLCEDIKLYFTDRFFAEFPKLGGVAVINRALRPADLAFYPIFSVAVFY